MDIFRSVAGAKTPRNKFNLSHSRKFPMGMGKIVPTFFSEVLPGDKFSVNQEILARMAPMIAPIMHKVDVWTHYFFVPNRLVWDNWDQFISGGEDGLQVPEHPYFQITNTTKANFKEGRLPDFLGVAPVDQTLTVDGTTKINALPFRAYNMIYNEYYRDQNTEEEIYNEKTDGRIGAVESNFTQILYRTWGKDYFTSALPFAQRGNPVELPTSVNYKEPAEIISAGSAASQNLESDANEYLNAGGSNPVGIDNIESLGLTVEDLRNSTRLQEWLERQARGGGRLTETILSHFGVMSKDQRIQRPEYLGGSKNPLSVSEVLNTSGLYDGGSSALDGGDVQGSMAGHGVAVGANKGFSRRFTEHGHVFGLCSVMPKRAYQQGITRNMTRFDKFDYYWPEFANIGEQAIKGKEIFAEYETNADVENEKTWAYQSRYAEYKHIQDTVHGKLRSDLNHWHMGEIFNNKPELNESFQKCVPAARIFAVTPQQATGDAGEELYCMVYNAVHAVRPMPYYGTPYL